MKYLANLAIAIAIASTSSVCGAQTIDWEVVNRFRVVKGEDANDRLIAGILASRDAGVYRAPIVATRMNRGIIGDVLGQRVLPTTWNERSEQYDAGWVQAKQRRIRLSIVGLKSGSRCLWRDGENIFEPNSCSDQERIVRLDTSTIITVDISRKGQATQSLKAVVQPKDYLIAVLGDSYASGEGNPHLPTIVNRPDGPPQPGYPAIWWDTRCHRSLMSSAAQAAAFYAERNRKSSVTFVSYACSGAEINGGILESFEGRQTVKQTQDFWMKAGQPEGYSDAVKTVGGDVKPNSSVLQSQIKRLSEILCMSQSAAACSDADRRTPDVLIIAIGGNDIGFGEIGRNLLMSDPKGRLGQWQDEQKKQISPLFKTLTNNFRVLAKRVKDDISPKHVLLMQYMDPTMYTDARGQDQPCGRNDKKITDLTGELNSALSSPTHENSSLSAPLNISLYNLLLTKGESALAHWVVSELNATIKQATDFPWTSNGGADVIPVQDLKGADGARRGVCSNISWFVTIFQSLNRQDWITSDPEHVYPLKLNSGTCAYEMKSGKCMVPAGNVTSGILHPNFFGHYNISQVIRGRIEAALSQ